MTGIRASESGAEGSGSFRPGDRVVVAPYGTGVICDTCFRQVLGQQAACYAVEFPGSSLRAFVPVGAPGGAGMRPALTSRETPRLLRLLREGRVTLLGQWSARQRQVTEILVSGDPYELAALTCELRRRNVRRGLPDLDRQAFRRAIRLLEQVRKLLDSAWNGGPP